MSFYKYVLDNWYLVGCTDLNQECHEIKNLCNQIERAVKDKKCLIIQGEYTEVNNIIGSVLFAGWLGDNKKSSKYFLFSNNGK